jgi:hypothetical protein
MKSVKKQRICVKFCFKVGKRAAETHDMLHEAYSNDALSQTMTYEWLKRFRNGRTSTDDDELSGKPSTSRSKPLIAQVKNIFHGNRQLTVREVAEEAGFLSAVLLLLLLLIIIIMDNRVHFTVTSTSKMDTFTITKVSTGQEG